MLFSANHGITDSLSFICCIEYEPNDVKYISRGCSGYAWERLLPVKGSILPLRKAVSALLSVLSHCGPQGNSAVVTSSSHRWSVARIVSASVALGSNAPSAK